MVIPSDIYEATSPVVAVDLELIVVLFIKLITLRENLRRYLLKTPLLLSLLVFTAMHLLACKPAFSAHTRLLLAQMCRLTLLLDQLSSPTMLLLAPLHQHMLLVQRYQPSLLLRSILLLQANCAYLPAIG